MTGTSTQWRDYALVTGNYWAFTLTDGALRMLVLLYFHQQGYSPVELATLFLLYEFCGVITNLFGGWIGARIGLQRTMHIGLGLQLIALAMLLVPSAWITVPWVMAAQALSGIAKDLNKMSAKSAVKFLVPAGAQGRLYALVAALTGSKNTLKGCGFFLGGALLVGFGFRGAILAMLVTLSLVWFLSLYLLRTDLGRSHRKPSFTDVFSTSAAVNRLSLARLCLFAARDVWFVVALPINLADQWGWKPERIGTFMAMWIIGYGAVQALAPAFTGVRKGQIPDGMTLWRWGVPLAGVPALLALIPSSLGVLLVGLLLFGGLFAVNSSLHSFLIVSYGRYDGVSLDVGVYYTANAMGRLLGTLLSGIMYQWYGLPACLLVSSVLIGIASVMARPLPPPSSTKEATYT